MAADRDRAEEPMPGLRVADLLEVERGERNVEQRLVVEVLLRPGAEALVGAQSAQGRVVDAEGVEVDGNADDGEGLVDGRELAAVRGEEAAGIVGAVAVAAVEGDALARQLAQGAIGLDVVEAKDAEGVRAVGDVVARGGLDAERVDDGGLPEGLDADGEVAGVHAQGRSPRDRGRWRARAPGARCLAARGCSRAFDLFPSGSSGWLSGMGPRRGGG